MKISEVSINYGETLNIGNYEARRVDFSYRATLAEGEDPIAVGRELLIKARAEARQAAERIIFADRH